ncbi:MAG: ATP-binding protein, partial [Acidobacteriota bacterium]
DLDPFDERLGTDIETLIFRLIQEALNNVLKHAGVDRARVALRRAGETLELRVADQGRGFDAAAVLAGGGPTTSAGLRGMRDRLELFGGRLEIASVPGGGTLVSATLSLAEVSR